MLNPTELKPLLSPLSGFISRTGVVASYAKRGEGPPLVLVHGSFSDHHTNWELVLPLLEQRFTVYALARRGRGETQDTIGHSLEDEAVDVATLIATIGEPAYVLGHSYGAHAALCAAAKAPERVRKLVLYEAPWPHIVSKEAIAKLESLASMGRWNDFAFTFFHDCLHVPAEELLALRETEFWPPIVEDAPASLGDIRALSRHDFVAARFRSLQRPVLLQRGSQSPRGLYVTDALAQMLPEARIEELAGQAHEGMTTAPALYAEAVTRFLLD